MCCVTRSIVCCRTILLQSLRNHIRFWRINTETRNWQSVNDFSTDSHVVSVRLYGEPVCVELGSFLFVLRQDSGQVFGLFFDTRFGRHGLARVVDLVILLGTCWVCLAL